MKQVEAGALVEVAYTLRAQGPEGEELETCTEENPFVFRVGQDEALEAFEQGLMGKREGEPFILHIDCAQDAPAPELWCARSLPTHPLLAHRRHTPSPRFPSNGIR